MFGGALVEGSGRRLPQWMLGRPDQVEKSGKTTEAHTKQSEEGPSSQTVTKSLGKGSLLVEKEKGLQSLDVLVKCRTKKRKLKAKQVNADSDTDISEDEQDKKSNRTRRKMSKPASQKRGKTKKFGLNSIEELDIQPLSEGDDFELTVDDLMTIAEEYVRANKDTEQEQEGKGKSDSRSRPSTTVSSSKESKDCKRSSATNDNISSFIQTSTTNDFSASCKANDSSSATEEIGIKAGGTGDPAHDMLNLFLGPLLRNL
ncbi:uncharacterized protein LOC133824083 [Humulus lupulus]|uniref:uncharacterized protein LOC133824083 n=1 Tax=Humulus lupulus TaxID=3486 RepID=UPI002B40F9BF|nr:uncharacterized protein LOC133824083 [Humulus lupulus]